MISNRSVQNVLDAVRIEDIVREYVDLKSRGSNMTGLCPFHKEKTPSFSVSPSKNIFKCFGCGKGGTPVQFLMEIEQLSFPEAIRKLSQKYGIEIEETHASERNLEEEKHIESLNIINDFANHFFQDQLWDTDEGKSIGLSYFKQRNFLESTLRKFEIGFAPEGDVLYQKAISLSYNNDYLKELGLISSSNRDFFKGRVMFPIHNQTGKVIAFAGRILNADAKIAKYINSPESELYNKSKTLYGLHLAKKSIREKDRCLLVEGYTDVLSLVQAGTENVVASSGTSLTEDQCHLIKRFCSNVTILYDGDDAGIKAAQRGLDLLIKEGLNVSIAMIPDNDDPDSFIRKVGSEKFEQFLQLQSKDFIIYKAELAIKETRNDPIRKANAANDIIRSVAIITDPIKRSIYIKQCSEILNIDESILLQTCTRIIKEEDKNKFFKERKDALDRDRIIIDNMSQDELVLPRQEKNAVFSDEFQERDIIRILILWGDRVWDEESSVFLFIMTNLSDVKEYFENPLYANVIKQVQELVDQNKTPDINYFITHTDETIRNLALDFTMSKFEYSQNWEKRWGIFLNTQKHPEENFIRDSTNSLLRFKLKKFNKQISLLEQHLNEFLGDEEELGLLMRTHQQLLQQRNHLAISLNTVVI